MRFYILQDFRKIQLVDRGIGIIMALLQIWNLSFGAQHLLVVCNHIASNFAWILLDTVES